MNFVTRSVNPPRSTRHQNRKRDLLFLLRCDAILAYFSFLAHLTFFFTSLDVYLSQFVSRHFTSSTRAFPEGTLFLHSVPITENQSISPSHSSLALSESQRIFCKFLIYFSQCNSRNNSRRTRLRYLDWGRHIELAAVRWEYNSLPSSKAVMMTKEMHPTGMSASQSNFHIMQRPTKQGYP